MKKSFYLILPFILILTVSAQTSLKKPIQFNEKDLVWKAGIPGTLISILEGNPQAPDSIYTIRLKMPPNFLVKPHWHNSDERVTVLSGSVYVGIGDTVNKNNSKKIIAGGFYVNPPDLHHFIWTDEAAEIQITGIGPWKVNYIDASGSKGN